MRFVVAGWNFFGLVWGDSEFAPIKSCEAGAGIEPAIAQPRGLDAIERLPPAFVRPFVRRWPFFRLGQITSEHECSAFTYEKRASDQIRTSENTR